MSRAGVAVVGAGVAGSVFARLLVNRKVLDIIIYDMLRSYIKPCGEVVPARLVDTILPSLGVEIPKVVNRIKRFVFIVGNSIVREYESAYAIWYSIEKSSWVNRIRTNLNIVNKSVMPSKLVRQYSIVVDARGPYSSKGMKILVWRAYVDNPGLDDDSVYIAMSGRELGLAWIFPHGDMLNIGGGFVGVSSPREHALRMIGKVVGKSLNPTQEAYSLVTIYPQIEYTLPGNVVKVGEAAGLIMSLGGEGIRPAVLSAAALADAIEVGEAGNVVLDLSKYIDKVKPLAREARLHSLMLKMASSLGDAGLKRLFENLDDDFIEAWLNGKLTNIQYVLKGLLALFGRKKSAKQVAG